MSTFDDFVAFLVSDTVEQRLREMFTPNQPDDDSDETFAAALLAFRMELKGEAPEGTEWQSPAFVDQDREGGDYTLTWVRGDDDETIERRKALVRDFMASTRPQLRKKSADRLDEVLESWFW